jgi:hypothetical protein
VIRSHLVGNSISVQQCQGNVGCDICPDGTIVDDSKVVTAGEGEAQETATCGEWFLFGCTFAEPDACTGLQDGVVGTECCTTGGEPDQPTTAPPPDEPTMAPPPDMPTTAPPPTEAPTSSAFHASTVVVVAAIAVAMLA